MSSGSADFSSEMVVVPLGLLVLYLGRMRYLGTDDISDSSLDPDEDSLKDTPS
jgi:hypothetical protein